MRISPIPPTGAPSPDGAAPPQSVRRLRMSTLATTPPPGIPENGAIPEPNGEVDAADEETKPLSPQFAALAKQRRALQVKERELLDREKALATASPTTGGAIDAARLKSDPLGVMLEHGVTYDQLTEAILAGQGGNADVQALRDEIKALKEGFDTKLTDRDKQAEQQVLAEMKREADTLAATGDDFEMIRETKSIPDVMQLIERTYREKGEVLDVREAMQLVEDELLAETLKVASLGKIKSRLLPPEPPPPPQQQQRQMRTLTNRDNAQPVITRRARALAAFHGTQPK